MNVSQHPMPIDHVAAEMPTEKVEAGEQTKLVSLLLIAFVAFYGIIRQLGWFQWPLRIQRTVFIAVRGILIDRFGFVRLRREPLDSGKWDQMPGWVLIPSALMAIHPITASAFVLQGSLRSAGQLLVFGTVYFVIIKLQGMRYKPLIFIMRLGVVHQYAMVFFIMSKEMNSLALRRALITRALASFLL
jgi:hypothetical protein